MRGDGVADDFRPEKRSDVMRQVRAKDTTPELAVRSCAHRLGYRFRLHRKGLPGSPDLVFPRLRKVIFVHGCFWHGHTCTRGGRVPRSNREYWVAKIRRNRERDAQVQAQLVAGGWDVLTIWECTIRPDGEWARDLAAFLARRDRLPSSGVKSNVRG